MSTFIIPGAVSHLSRITDSLDDSISGVLIHAKGPASNLVSPEGFPERIRNRIFTLYSLNEVSNEKPDARDIAAYEKCLARVFSDARVHYLATRSALDSPFNNAVAIDKITLNSVLMIRETGASRLISSSPPHSLESWILAKCFECLDLPVYILERTPINDRAWVCKGTDQQKVVSSIEKQPDNTLSEAAKKLIRDQRNSAPGVTDKDGYYLSRMDLSTIKGANTNHWWSLKREILGMFSGSIVSLPLKLASSYKKRCLYKSYQAIAVTDLPDKPFVVFFMHYQPERTSVPDGLFFAQQWLAIRRLSLALPDGWEVVVREHPTTWLKPLDVTVRTQSLYADIESLGNASLCSMDLDTFELIDRSSAVSTLTGSVGFQAILRNRPVLAFGLPPYKDHPACFMIDSTVDLTEVLTAIRNNDFDHVFTDEALCQYLAWVEQHSISVDPEEPDWMEARLKNFAELYKQILSGRLMLG